MLNVKLKFLPLHLRLVIILPLFFDFIKFCLNSRSMLYSLQLHPHLFPPETSYSGIRDSEGASLGLWDPPIHLLWSILPAWISLKFCEKSIAGEFFWENAYSESNKDITILKRWLRNPYFAQNFEWDDIVLL